MTIAVSVDGHVAELTLNRPERRNSMTWEMGAAIAAAVQELNARDDVRVLIVRGAGDCFSAGGDFGLLEERANSRGDENRRAMRAFYASYLSLLEVRVPAIAALHGHALGAGLCFALACDVRIASDDAKLGVTFVRIGLHPGMGATHLLERAVGVAHAADLLLSGRVVDAAEALRIGLVSRVCLRGELLQTARALADDIASAAPVAVQQTKATLRRPRSLEDALDREAAMQAIDYATDDLREAILAFRERRPPRFEGR
ncbi:MAG TPA: enoyl-CoA hydratase-related protein [Polyangiaceae bacterium]|nr:enoyl-CoA hydratase-related protein [Polyangiaceae bacterium]